MDEICVAKFDVYECRKSDRASALSGAQLTICAAQTPEFPDTIPTISSAFVCFHLRAPCFHHAPNLRLYSHFLRMDVPMTSLMDGL